MKTLLFIVLVAAAALLLVVLVDYGTTQCASRRMPTTAAEWIGNLPCWITSTAVDLLRWVFTAGRGL
jgi:hypothetical protein